MELFIKTCPGEVILALKTHYFENRYAGFCTMRLIKIVFIFLFVVTGLYFGASLFIPESYQIERTALLNAPGDIVFEQVGSFKKWEKWNPWKEKDPKLKTLFGPDDGKPGSYWLWKSSTAGEGRMTSSKIEDQKQISYTVSFEKPYKTEAEGYLKLEPEGQNTRVTWVMTGRNPFHLRWMNLLLDKWLSPLLESGLEQLKITAEQEAKVLQETYFGYRIKPVRFEGAKIAYIRKSIPFGETDEFFKESFIKIKEETVNCKFRTDGNKMALYYFRDEVNEVASIAAALPVMGDSTLGPDFGIMHIKPKKSLVVHYYGGYKSNQNAYKALDNYLKNNRMNLKRPIVEEYVSGPEQVRDSSKWYTRIWYFLE